MSARSTRVFISYSHDSAEHTERVGELGDRLRFGGVDCEGDQQEESPPEGWPRWMANQIEAADFVLTICTRIYALRALGRDVPGAGLGATWEGSLIIQEIYNSGGHNEKFIPVVFEATDIAHIPLFLQAATRYDLSTNHGYEDLYRRLTAQSRRRRLPLGRVRILPTELRDIDQTIATDANVSETGLNERIELLDAQLQRLMLLLEKVEVAQSGPPHSPPRTDVLDLTFRELIKWAEGVDLKGEQVSPIDRQAYALAANQLFFHERIEEHDAAKAVSLLLLSGDFQRAGAILLYAYDLTRTMREISRPSILEFFGIGRLPSEMPLDLRIVIRVTQITGRRKHALAIDALRNDLEVLVDAAGSTEGYAIAAAAFNEARWVGKYDPHRALKYLVKAVELRPTATGPLGTTFPVSLDAAWPIVLELTAIGVNTREKLFDWLQALERVPQTAREHILQDETDCIALANRFWLDESHKTEDSRDWDYVHTTLQVIERWARDREAWLLFAAARRGRIVVRGEYEIDLEGAVALAVDAPAAVRSDAHASFLLDEIIASQFLYSGDAEKAHARFKDVLTRVPPSTTLLTHVAMKAARAAGAAGDIASAVGAAALAVENVTLDPLASDTDPVIANAELAIAHWISGDHESSFHAFDIAAEALFQINDRDSRFRGLVVRFHYVGGYFAKMARFGEPPTVDADGKPFRAPTSGAFLIELEALSELYSEEKLFAIALCLAAFAEAVRQDDRMKHWAYRTVALAKDSVEDRGIAAFDAIPYLVTELRFDEALGLARDMWVGMSAKMSTEADGETMVASFGFFPAFMVVARAAVFGGKTTGAEQLLTAIRNQPMISIWRRAADLVETVFLSSDDAGTRLARTLAISHESQTHDPAESIMQGTASLAVSLLPDVTVLDCLRSHERAFDPIAARLQRYTTIYRLQIVPFFEDYWRMKFDRNRHAFRRPAVVEATLLKAFATHLDQRPKAILRVMAEGLDAK